MSSTQTLAKKPSKVTRSAVSAPNELGEEVIQTSFRLPRGRWTKLQQLGIEERLSIQSIVITALEAEFQRRGKKF